ncbi:MAG: S-methyl-5-thioribose-1-phosphate isomerase, partial [Gammaproteobacteria bacterium]|nr:S-methyl-5-thioribose-1-phosphate isomerase [Gammaproteobacteria bacterium]
MKDMPRSVEWRDNTLILLDQRKLPQVEEVVLCDAIEQVFYGIKTLTVRGAPAIGIAAAYGLLVGSHDKDATDIRAEFNERCDYLISARPTAVNLAWAVNRMRERERRCY